MIQFFSYSTPVSLPDFCNRAGLDYKSARKCLEYLIAAGYLLPRAQGFVKSPHVKRAQLTNLE